MSLQTKSQQSQTLSASTQSSMTSRSIQSAAPSSASISANSAKVTVEVPANSSIPLNPFDPTWIKLWEQVGPISYLALLCVFIWLLTRFVETVKSK